MIILLGASGFVGQAFQAFFRSRSIAFLPVSRLDFDYTNSTVLADALTKNGATFLVNAAGYTGKPNVDACELQKAQCLQGNAVLPGRIREACEAIELPWGHVSSGCIYSGRRADGGGFHEMDAPNFSFRSNNCSFYSGSKALGEEVLEDAEQCFIWRLRIPFDHRDNPRNYLSKLQNYACLLDAENSISHLGDFVESCYACWERKLPFETYNLVNRDPVTTRDVADMISNHLLPNRQFKFFQSEEEFMETAAKTPRSNCVLDSTKAEEALLPMRPVLEALEQSLQDWEKS